MKSHPDNAVMSCRKSKRLARRQEDDAFWLMHNFPQGINSTVLSADIQPSSVRTSINQKLLTQNLDSSAMELPKILRSGRSVSPKKKKPQVSSPDGEAKTTRGRGRPVRSVRPSGCTTRAKSQDSALNTRNGVYKRKTRTDSDDHPPKVKRQSRKEVPEGPVEENASVSARPPRLAVEPNKITTRSGAQYSMNWKKQKRQKKASVESKETEDINGKAAPAVDEKKVKKEPMDVSEIENNPRFNNRRFSVGGTNGRRGKRRRLSLLPVCKVELDPFDCFTEWYGEGEETDTTPSPRSESPASSKSPDGSESAVPVTTKRAGRTASLNCRALLSALIAPDIKKSGKRSPPNTTKSPKRLSPVLKKSSSKTDLTSGGEARSFVKVKISKTFHQKVEFVSSTMCQKFNGLPQPLHNHESMILSNRTRVKIRTNGWSWAGELLNCCTFYGRNSMITRLYYTQMTRNDSVIRVGDSVSLMQTNQDAPFVGKIISMWQDNLGEMMVTMSWFYRSADLENIPPPHYPAELYLSKHTDDNSVACIQEKVHVLSYPEYCRYQSSLAEVSRPRGGPRHRTQSIVPNAVKWREDKFPLTTTPPDSVFYCRRVYDFRLRRPLKQELYYTQFM